MTIEGLEQNVDKQFKESLFELECEVSTARGELEDIASSAEAMRRDIGSLADTSREIFRLMEILCEIGYETNNFLLRFENDRRDGIDQ